jgi:hypothetical protein
VNVVVEFLSISGAFAKLQNTTISFVVSVRSSLCSHGTRHQLNGFWRNLAFELVSKICLENSSSIKIWQEQRELNVNLCLHVWQYLAEFFLKWENFQTKVVEKVRTDILCSASFLRKSCRLWDNVENMMEADRPQMKIQYGACDLLAGYARTHTHTHTLSLSQKM